MVAELIEIFEQLPLGEKITVAHVLAVLYELEKRV